MGKITSFLQSKLAPMANKFAALTFISIIRNALLGIIPITIVGAIGTLLSNLPFQSVANFLSPLYPFFQGLSAATSSILALAVAVSIGFYTAQHYKMNTIMGAMTALIAFIASQVTPELTIDTANFGATGLLSAILISYLSVYIGYWCIRLKIIIKLPDGVPTMVAESFAPIISIFISTSIVLALRLGLGMDLNAIIGTAISPLTNSMNTLPGVIVLFFLMSLVFLCGINSGVVAAFTMPTMFMYTELNAAAYAAGEPLEYIYSWGFSTMIAVGGTGATLALVILCVFSKSKQYRAIGRVSLFPAIFNINEPLIFGVPIMFNAILAIPFLLAPVFNVVSTWFLMKGGLIGMPAVSIPWTSPIIMSGFLTTGGDWRAAIWSGLMVVFDLLIYLPFFKVLERQALQNESAEIQEKKTTQTT